MKWEGLDSQARSRAFWASILVAVLLAGWLANLTVQYLLHPLLIDHLKIQATVRHTVAEWLLDTPLASIAPWIPFLMLYLPDIVALLLIGLAIGRCLPNTWQTWVTVLAFSFAVVSLAYGGSPWGFLSMGIIWAKWSLVLAMSVFSVVILGSPFLAAWFAARRITRASPQNGRSLIVCPRGGRLSEEVQDLEATWDRRGLGVELIIVFFLCIFPLILLSTWLAWNLGKGIRVDTSSITLLALGHMTGSLLLFVYLIRRRGESAQRFGFVFHCSVIPASVGLFLLCCTVYSAGYHSAYFLGIIDPDSILRQADRPMADSVSTLEWLRAIVFAPLFEETLVRAYLMTRLKDLGWGTVWVVLASTFIQTSYHTYQGSIAVAHIPTFLMFSLYYARYRNVLTVILAHSYISLLWEAFGDQ